LTSKVIQSGTSPWSPWRLIDSGPARGSFNMALDEAIHLRAREGKSPPTIRFYAWKPAAISLGYAQSWEGEFDEAACRARGVEVYRRITGGRAVLHDDEVTYSVTAGAGAGGFAPGVLPVYLRIGTALAAGLEGMGLAVEMARPSPRRAWGEASALSPNPGHHPVCFSSAAGYEITCRGRKIVGSALKRDGESFLQHGSILLAGHGARLAELLGERYRASGEAVSPGAVPCGAEEGLRDLLGREISYREVVDAMAAGFARAWETKLVPAEPDGEELKLAMKLEKEKYLTPEWNLHRRFRGGRS
jgi:lipoate-protein ligase A